MPLSFIGFGNFPSIHHLLVDYISIALLTPKAELLFFSSRPSIDWNIIEHNAWISDFRFQHDFFHSEQSHCLNIDAYHVTRQ